jgi:hypothetical protein
MYPPIRKLPLLGVQWADLYRRMKIQETVYELLNQQYELARIQEAKEVATVNVIDPANIPEKKSWPPRLWIMLVLTFLSVSAAGAWIIGSARWEQVDPLYPGKIFAQNVWKSVMERKAVAFSRFEALRGRGKSPEGSDSRNL